MQGDCTQSSQTLRTRIYDWEAYGLGTGGLDTYRLRSHGLDTIWPQVGHLWLGHLWFQRSLGTTGLDTCELGNYGSGSSGLDTACALIASTPLGPLRLGRLWLGHNLFAETIPSPHAALQSHARGRVLAMDVLRHITTYYDVPRRTTTYHEVLRRITTFYNVLPRTTKYYHVLRRTTTYYEVLRRTTTHYDVLRRTTTYYDVLRRTTMHYEVLRRTTTYYDVLRRTTK